jgi:aminoglycoside phosphotransferase (APT) family kinase protein
VEVEPLPGGLESTVLRARISPPDDSTAIPSRIVVKALAGGDAREAEIYEVLWRHLDRPPAVRVLGRQRSAGGTYLYLEEAEPTVAWPWSEQRASAAVCRVLARLHESADLPREAFVCDYETELTRSASSTLDAARQARDATGRRYWRRPGDLRRIVAGLPRIRRRLLGEQATVIHGDVHPGNVIVRGPAAPEVVLIDWARARLGSPLEDIASWLHSLGCWEPEARRRHDTLMRIYLDARRTRLPFTSALREDYWLASACNGLSGAIRYHLAVLSDPAGPEGARHDSTRALASWQRIARRAAAVLSTNPDRRTRAPCRVGRSTT